MGNYAGTTNLLKVKVDNKKPRKGLIEIIDSLDSDYEEYSERIVNNIIQWAAASNGHYDVIDMIDRVLTGYEWEVIEEDEDGEEYNVLEDVSTFFLNNCTYCSGYESDIVDQGGSQLVIISYGN